MELVSRAAIENRLARVTAVCVRIGRFSGVMPEALRFAWDVLRKGTPFALTELEIEEVPIHLRCHNCESEYAAEPDDLTCPLCESLEYEILSGREMDLHSIIGEINNDT